MGIHGIPSHVERVKKRDSWMHSQAHPVDHARDVIEPKGRKMSAKIIKGGCVDSIMDHVYTAHPSMHREINGARG